MKAVRYGKVIADSDQTIIMEGNHYFPPVAVNRDFLEQSDFTTICCWKGEAHYYNIVVHSERNENAPWYCREPLEKTTNIRNYVAFWRGVKVE
ncbi:MULTISPECIES: DUF427 domain-containing protein [unclassified Mesotoga]|jgi:uncharacterized protein (DUF427 family)|uniref:DUF427 domain-containing protein n=1 Tax=unclassified Mesotoga TaxID=1184398 RepID=UPI000EF206F5|nr:MULTISPECIES: DUF427 domain-containing protein [unclassified Mesotoga]MDI9367093.1 DUF427 domain-containing protein [Thermotogota bacterium]NLT44874.1 DUF427 domain-containing protein [Thermotogaceae bacterium]MDD3680954.1 DUF427 domain-containing protein [Mesotoga sp.]MDD4206323.1 DUF427 domain-containing protein [Mesotoga sp.]MDD4825682.1 DUF427 domain-containing protein [Mesotoga sp.]